jgi:hypothetical protein
MDSVSVKSRDSTTPVPEPTVPATCPFRPHDDDDDRASDASGRQTPSTSSDCDTAASSDVGVAGPSIRKPSCPVVFTQEVNEHVIRHSLDARIAYLTDFLGFTSADAEIITEVAPLVNGIIPEMVDGMYAKLFEFDITKRVFMDRNQVRFPFESS